MLLAITIHELSHAWTAYRLGDPTAKLAGRISLNPLAHWDLIGTTLILFIGFGWAKPVPVNPLNFRHPGRDNALVSLAGPASNFACAVVFGLGLRFFLLPAMNVTDSPFVMTAASLARNIVLISLVLGVFNLIPIPPLDGSHILRELLPFEMRGAFDSFTAAGPVVLVVFLVLMSLPQFGKLLWTPVLFMSRIICGPGVI